MIDYLITFYGINFRGIIEGNPIMAFFYSSWVGWILAPILAFFVLSGYSFFIHNISYKEKSSYREFILHLGIFTFVVPELITIIHNLFFFV